jgi:hypothetical protein
MGRTSGTSLVCSPPRQPRNARLRLLEVLLPTSLEDYDGLCELADREFGHPWQILYSSTATTDARAGWTFRVYRRSTGEE